MAVRDPVGYQGLQRALTSLPLPTTSTAIIPEEQSQLCFQGDRLLPSISKAEQSKQQFPDCIPSSPLPPSRFPVNSAAVSSSIIQTKWFSMNLPGAPAPLQATDQQRAQLSPHALAHPCLALNPRGVILWLSAGRRAAWKAWLPTVPGKVRFTPS